MQQQHQGEKPDKVTAAFQKFDTNRDGYLSREEFTVVSLLEFI